MSVASQSLKNRQDLQDEQDYKSQHREPILSIQLAV